MEARANIIIRMQLGEPSKSPIENYKGVMLCSRPGDNNTPQGPKPFCARVVPPDALGLVPFQKAVEVKPLKKGPSIVSRHKRWLEEFGLRQIIRKEEADDQRDKEEEKFRRIREQAELDRQKAKTMKEEYNTISKSVMNVLDEDENKPPKSSALNAENLRKLNELGMQQQPKPFKKKKEKPAWAQTEAQAQEKEENQENELLDFFENTDVDQFINDTEVNAILKTLKDKIETMKKQENWREKQAARAKAKQQRQQDAEKQGEQDNRSVASSRQSEGGKSVASQKSAKRIEELKERLEKKKQGVDQWDKSSKASKISANLEQKIAKNVADEVLRSYGLFKGVHSNASIRRLLEQQAARQLVEPHPRPIITTVVREKTALDMNNLPYLHRNPAI